MKKIILSVVLIASASFFFSSCEKDEDKVVFTSATTSTLTASATTFKLEKAKADENAVTFAWNAVTYDFPSEKPKYSLQFAIKGSSFKGAIEKNYNELLTKTLTQKELNEVAQSLKLLPNEAVALECRSVTRVSNLEATAVYSNVIEISITPYFDIKKYNVVYVPGSYQGWMPDKAETLATLYNDGVYEGYINFPDADTKFKITPFPNWSRDWGDDGSKKGILKEKGVDIAVAEAGYYRIVADTASLTYSVTKTNWGVFGSGIAKEQAMTFDAAKKTWSITTDLIGDKEIKFRANASDEVNLGDNEGDGLLEAEGNSIKISATGNYTIVLNLSIPGNYAYYIKKN
jgi:hypothetical protein